MEDLVEGIPMAGTDIIIQSLIIGDITIEDMRVLNITAIIVIDIILWVGVIVFGVTNFFEDRSRVTIQCI